MSLFDKFEWHLIIQTFWQLNGYLDVRMFSIMSLFSYCLVIRKVSLQSVYESIIIFSLGIEKVISFWQYFHFVSCMFWYPICVKNWAMLKMASSLTNLEKNSSKLISMRLYLTSCQFLYLNDSISMILSRLAYRST